MVTALVVGLIVSFSTAVQAGVIYSTQYTSFVEDEDVREAPVDSRTPLILIHGFTGTDVEWFSAVDGSTTEEKAYFSTFSDYFFETGLDDLYNLYRFHYLSNEISVSDIAAALRDALEAAEQNSMIETGPIVIIGHSMGGLVARSFMEEKTHQSGDYSGQLGGERVKHLITLGTPHHGSHAANDTARNAGDSNWNSLLQIVDGIFWQGVTVSQPSRSDLRWDNYNDIEGLTPGYANAPEVNDWLSDMNQNSQYSNKITGYVGGVKNEGGEISTKYSLHLLWSHLKNVDSSEFGLLAQTCDEKGYLPNKNTAVNPFAGIYAVGPYDEDKPYTFRMKLCFAGVLLEKIIASDNDGYTNDNDGLVPIDSGEFRNGAVFRKRWYEGYDHWDLKEEREDPPIQLFSDLQTDIENIGMDFTVESHGTSVICRWAGQAAFDNEYAVLRSDSPEGPYTQLNATAISTGEPSYSYTDETVVFGNTYYYKIAHIDASSVTREIGMQSVGIGHLGDVLHVLKVLTVSPTMPDSDQLHDADGNSVVDLADALLLLQIVAEIR